VARSPSFSKVKSQAQTARFRQINHFAGDLEDLISLPPTRVDGCCLGILQKRVSGFKLENLLAIEDGGRVKREPVRAGVE
jgi:hypothetical protein